MIQNHYDQINFTERKHVFMYFNIAIKLFFFFYFVNKLNVLKTKHNFGSLFLCILIFCLQYFKL